LDDECGIRGRRRTIAPRREAAQWGPLQGWRAQWALSAVGGFRFRVGMPEARCYNAALVCLME